MRSRRVSVALGAAILMTVTAAGTYAVAAGVRTSSSDHRIDHQVARWRIGDLTFTGSDWGDLDWSTDGKHFVSDGNYVTAYARGLVTVTVSASIRGGPVDIRVLAGNRVMRPGLVHFEPSAHGTAFSFTFTRRVGHPDCGRLLFVQLRPATDQDVTVKGADLVATYKHYTPPGDVGCV